MTIKKLSVLLMITSLLFILSGCVPGSGASTPRKSCRIFFRYLAWLDRPDYVDLWSIQ
jgi:hypothetical protein